MALSYVTYAGDAATTNFSVTFAYIQTSHVKVYLDGVLKTVTTHYTWFNPTTIQFLVAPGAGVVVRIERETPNTARLVDFQDAGNLTEYDLDTSADQLFYLVQEAQDAFTDEALGLATDGKWDAESKIIKNVLDPTANQDAATKKYADDLYASALATVAAAVAATAADVVTTNADVVSTNADAASTAADAISTAADAVSTAADAAATAADLVQTNLDQISCTANAGLTALDAAATAADAVSTAADAVATAADAAAAAVSKGFASEWAIKTVTYVNDGIDIDYSSKAWAIDTSNLYGCSKEWAIEAEDVTVGVTSDYSALHHAAKASASASAASSSASAASTSASAAAASAASVDVSTMRNNRNLLINGCMRIWQRGTLFTSPAANSFLADRWKWQNSTTGAVTVSRQNYASTAQPYKTYMNIVCTTADTSIGAADFAYIFQMVEAPNMEHARFGNGAAKDLLLSFNHQHTKTGTHSFTIRNSANTRSYMGEYTQSVSDALENTQVVIPGDMVGTWLVDAGAVGLRLGFCLAVGSTYSQSTEGWYSANVLGSANQVNNLDSTSNAFRISHIQLEVDHQDDGAHGLFEQRDYGIEHQLCERYYQLMYLNSYIGMGTARVDGAGLMKGCYMPLRTQMAVAPTITNSSSALTRIDTSTHAGTVTAASTTFWVASGTRNIYLQQTTGTVYACYLILCNTAMSIYCDGELA